MVSALSSPKARAIIILISDSEVGHGDMLYIASSAVTRDGVTFARVAWVWRLLRVSVIVSIFTIHGFNDGSASRREKFPPYQVHPADRYWILRGPSPVSDVTLSEIRLHLLQIVPSDETKKFCLSFCTLKKDSKNLLVLK